MTAYGRAESSKGGIEFIVEIRSGNYRYREIILKLPQFLQPFEERARSVVSSKLKRGRVEVSVQMKDNGHRPVKLELNRPLVKAYVDIFDELAKELGLKQTIDLSLFTQLKDIIITKQDSVDFEDLWPDINDVLENALLSFEKMRKTEGETLERDFLERLGVIEKCIKDIEGRSKETVTLYRDKLIQRIHRLIDDIDVNEDRLAQEVAFMAEKSDITEELVRAKSHLEQFKDYMAKDDVVGRRLDFLLQEINREVNTIGSKASDSLISQVVVEIKAELEKLREQTQNVE
jgi:uncharacterized protein (TIGR00255 family)